MTDTYKKENANKKLTIKSRDWLHREQCTIFEESDAPGAIINQIIKDNLFDMQCMINILERDTEDLEEDLYAQIQQSGTDYFY